MRWVACVAFVRPDFTVAKRLPRTYVHATHLRPLAQCDRATPRPGERASVSRDLAHQFAGAADGVDQADARTHGDVRQVVVAGGHGGFILRPRFGRRSPQVFDAMLPALVQVVSDRAEIV